MSGQRQGQQLFTRTRNVPRPREQRYTCRELIWIKVHLRILRACTHKSPSKSTFEVEADMNTVRVLAGAVLLISLGGCGAIDLVATKIGDYKQFKVPNVDTFLILDDINAQNIKITSSTSTKASAFMNNIFTFGLSYPDAPEGKMKSAAVDYLKSTNRNCTIVSDKKVERMGWEFQYHCEAKTEQEGKKS